MILFFILYKLRVSNSSQSRFIIVPILFLPPPPLGISGLFRLLFSTSYSWSLTFTSADSPLRVVPDFDLHRNQAGAHDTFSWMHAFYQSCHKSMWASDYIFQASEASGHISSDSVWVGDTEKHPSKISYRAGVEPRAFRLLALAFYRSAISTQTNTLHVYGYENV